MKNRKTECSGLNWGDLLILLDRLKKERDYTFLLLISIGSYTGLRISDIIKLRWSDIYEKRELALSEEKTNKFRKITINESLDEIIRLCFLKISNSKNKNCLVFAN